MVQRSKKSNTFFGLAHTMGPIVLNTRAKNSEDPQSRFGVMGKEEKKLVWTLNPL